MSHEQTSTANATQVSAVDTAASAAMLGLIDGFRISRVVWAAARLGIADLLRKEPKPADQLAAQTQSHAPSLARLLRALVAIGILAQDENGRFELTSLGATLRSDVPGSLRSWALLALGDENQRAWGELLLSLRTGEPAFEHAFGIDVWEHRRRHPEHGRLFDAAMASLMHHAGAALVAAYPFSEVKRLVDVGGGDATLLITILRAHPALAGVLYDLPHVAASARQRVEEAGVAARCAIVAGDALQRVPEGGDCYLLARVIHDWDDSRAIAILRNCRNTLPQHGRVLLLERLFPEPLERSPAALAATLTDLTMMVSTGGRERSDAEYRVLLAAAGLDPIKVIPTASGLSVIECAATPHEPFTASAA